MAPFLRILSRPQVRRLRDGGRSTLAFSPTSLWKNGNWEPGSTTCDPFCRGTHSFARGSRGVAGEVAGELAVVGLQCPGVALPPEATCSASGGI